MSDAKIDTMVMITGREYEALRTENERLKTSGIAELAAHNPSVMDWIHHWERRTLKAEAENEKLRSELRWIDEQRYTDRDTINPYNAFEKVGKLNSKIIAIMDRARAALEGK